jgi:large conductance mechanosensitive channel
MALFKGFQQFLFRGNIIELAVAFVIGGAFASVVTSFVDNLLTPVISMIFGEPSFVGLHFTINDSIFYYGAFLTSLFSFIAIAAAVYFVVVVPMGQIMAQVRSAPPADPTTKRCPECLSEVPLEARRCAFCTSEIGAAS